jgi:hypothetical protein
MRVTTVSVVADRGRSNEDFVGAVRTGTVVVDGAFIPGAEDVCHHGVAWYAHRLGQWLLDLLAAAGDEPLPGLLGTAIERVTGEHRDRCDPADPRSPWAAVAVVRVRHGLLDVLVLGDATVVVDRPDGSAPVVVTDPREPVVSATYEPAYAAARDADERHRVLRELRARRNQAGGFWVAKDDPRAADEAVTAQLPVGEVRAVALMSNGASRVVDRFGLTDWAGLVADLASVGPADVVRRVREAERLRRVAQDDATIAYCTDLAP